MTNPTEFLNDQMSSKEVIKIWFPSALSFFFLLAELPAVTMIISQKGTTDDIASFGIVLSLLLIFTTPCLALGATVISLSKGRPSLRKLFFFSLLLGGSLSLLMSLFLASPISHFVFSKLLELPKDVEKSVVQGMWAFSLVPFFVALRRYWQGLLIFLNNTKAIAIATWVRVCLSIPLAYLTIFILNWPIVFAGSISIFIAAVSESLVLTFHTRRKFLQTSSTNTDCPSFSKILRFHSPIAATTMLGLSYQPMISSALANLPLPEVSLAAWTIIFQLLYMFISFSMELDGITIAILRNKHGGPALKKFCFGLCCCLMGILLIIALTPLSSLYFEELNHLDEATAKIVRDVFIYSIIIPALFVIRYWLRGRIITQGFPSRVQYTTGIGVIALVLTFFTSFLFPNQPGVYFAVTALYVSLLTEISTARLFIWLEDRKGAIRAARLSAQH